MNGDRDAASKLLHQHYSRIYGYLRRLVGNNTDASDLTQETFRRVWRSLPRFRLGSTVVTWMHRIAYCTYIDWRRRQRPATRQSEHWWRELPCRLPSPSEVTQTTEQLHRLWDLVDQLKDKERQAVHLHYGQNLSLTETAEILEMPLSTLKLRLRKAVDRLRARIQEEEFIGGPVET